MPKPKISLIAAMSSNRAIGLDNALPWPEPIPADWAHLKKVTAGKKMIMGRKSYDNPHRLWSEAGNYVITRQKDYPVDDNFEVASSLEDAIKACENEKEIYILGGEQIFTQSISLADKIVLTRVNQEFEGDTFFPAFEHLDFEEVKRLEFEISEESPYPMSIVTYEKV